MRHTVFDSSIVLTTHMFTIMTVVHFSNFRTRFFDARFSLNFKTIWRFSYFGCFFGSKCKKITIFWLFEVTFNRNRIKWRKKQGKSKCSTEMHRFHCLVLIQYIENNALIDVVIDARTTRHYIVRTHKTITFSNLSPFNHVQHTRIYYLTMHMC